MSLFNDKVAKLLSGHEALLTRRNEPIEEGNGVTAQDNGNALSLRFLLLSVRSCVLTVLHARRAI